MGTAILTKTISLLRLKYTEKQVKMTMRLIGVSLHSLAKVFIFCPLSLLISFRSKGIESRRIKMKQSIQVARPGISSRPQMKRLHTRAMMNGLVKGSFLRLHFVVKKDS